MKTRVANKLEKALSPDHLEVIDESYKHSGHGDFEGSEGTHFQIIIKSKDLTSLSRVKAHQEIYKILSLELEEGIHALAIQILR